MWKAQSEACMRACAVWTTLVFGVHMHNTLYITKNLTRLGLRFLIWHMKTSNGFKHVEKLILLPNANSECTNEPTSLLFEPHGPFLLFDFFRVSQNSSRGQRRPWSACAFAQADLGHRCLHMRNKNPFQVIWQKWYSFHATDGRSVAVSQLMANLIKVYFRLDGFKLLNFPEGFK